MPEVVAITGKFAFPRAYYKDKITKLGHTFSKTITKKVTVLVSDNVCGVSSKLDKARLYGIRIVGEEFFQEDETSANVSGVGENEAAVDDMQESSHVSPWVLLKEGDVINVSGSTSAYQVRLRGGNYYCTCPAWRNAGGIPVRTCKHLRRVLGPEFDTWRMRNAPGAALEDEDDNQDGPWTVKDVEQLLPNREIVKYARLHLNKTCVSKPVEKPTAKTVAKRGRLKKSKTESKTKKPNPKKMKKEPAPKLMLAHKWDEEFHDPTGYWMSEKYDGLRAFWDGEKFLSRAGNPFYAPEFFTKNLPKDVTLDGELYMGRKMFEETSSIVRTQDSTDKRWGKLKFMVFDVPSRDEDLFEDRQQWLNETFVEHEFVQIVKQKLVKSKKNVLELRDAVVAQGAEGLMLRRPKTVYVGKRTKDLLKVKKWFDEEAKVVAHVPGKGKHTGRMGALQCVSETGVSFRIGTGFDDQQRENPPAIGSFVTFKYQELTKAGVPRFPVYLRPAEDHHAEQHADQHEKAE